MHASSKKTVSAVVAAATSSRTSPRQRSAEKVERTSAARALVLIVS